jgi:hypothetical protein
LHVTDTVESGKETAITKIKCYVNVIYFINVNVANVPRKNIGSLESPQQGNLSSGKREGEGGGERDRLSYLYKSGRLTK